MIKKYQNEFEATLRLKRNVESTISGRHSKSFLLNEEQVTFLGTLVNNNPKTVKFKRMIVNEFYRMKNHIIESEKTKLPQSKVELIEAWLDAEKQKEKLQIENKQKDFRIKKIEPKAEMYNRTMDSTTTFSAKEVAKNLDLKQGANILFKELRKLKILMDRKNNSEHNTPYQKYKNRNYFKVIKVPRGNTGIIDLQTRFYQKGIDFIAQELPNRMFNKCEKNDSLLNINEILELKIY